MRAIEMNKGELNKLETKDCQPGLQSRMQPPPEVHAVLPRPGAATGQDRNH